MFVRTSLLLLAAFGFFLTAVSSPALEPRKHEPLFRAIEELKKAREFLVIEKRHEQVEKAQRALREAIAYVRETKSEFGERRKRLIDRLEILDKKLDLEHTKARAALDDAIEDLEFAVKH